MREAQTSDGRTQEIFVEVSLRTRGLRAAHNYCVLVRS